MAEQSGQTNLRERDDSQAFDQLHPEVHDDKDSKVNIRRMDLILPPTPQHTPQNLVILSGPVTAHDGALVVSPCLPQLELPVCLVALLIANPVPLSQLAIYLCGAELTTSATKESDRGRQVSRMRRNRERKQEVKKEQVDEEDE